MQWHVHLGCQLLKNVFWNRFLSYEFSLELFMWTRMSYSLIPACLYPPPRVLQLIVGITTAADFSLVSYNHKQSWSYLFSITYTIDCGIQDNDYNSNITFSWVFGEQCHIGLDRRPWPDLSNDIQPPGFPRFFKDLKDIWIFARYRGQHDPQWRTNVPFF